MNIKVASSWFNLCNAFLDMVFKHFGNENAHNELAWTSYFLSQLSSWASPSGLAKVQKQTLYSYVPGSLLTFTAITSDSLSCLHFIKISSSRETLTSPFLPCAHPPKNKRHQTRHSAQNMPWFLWKKFSKRESWVSGRISSTSLKWQRDGLLPKAHENIMEGKLMKTTFKRLRGKKKKRFACDSSQGRCTWSYHASWEKRSKRKRNWSHHLKLTFHLSSSSLWTNAGILAASSFLPHPQ